MLVLTPAGMPEPTTGRVYAMIEICYAAPSFRSRIHNFVSYLA